MGKMMDNFVIILLYFILTFLHNAAGGCVYPEELQHSTWIDGSKGEITYTDKKMTGWPFTVYSKTIIEWECLVKNDDFVVSRSPSISLFGQIVTGYLCQKFKKHNDDLFSYYQFSDIQINALKERIYVTTEPVNNLCDVCVPTEQGPKDEEFVILRKQGTANTSLPSSNLTVGCNPCDFGANCRYTNESYNVVVPPDPQSLDNGDTDDDSDDNDDDNEQNEDKEVKIGIIVGSVIGSVVVLVAMISVFIWIMRTRK